MKLSKKYKLKSFSYNRWNAITSSTRPPPRTSKKFDAPQDDAQELWRSPRWSDFPDVVATWPIILVVVEFPPLLMVS